MVNQEVASAVPVSRSRMMISQINKSFQLYQQLYHCITVSAVSAVSLYQLTRSRLAVSGGWTTLAARRPAPRLFTLQLHSVL